MGLNDDPFTTDLKSRLTDLELMEKYRISASELRKRLLTLIRNGVIRSRDVYRRPIIYDYEVEGEARRSTPRYPLKTLLPVYLVDRPQTTPAVLVDINEKGGCVVGLGVPEGEKVTLTIDPEGLVEAGEIQLEALFRWVEKGDDPGSLAAGFEIFAISSKDFVLLHDLIRAITA
jgi:hypothetical protein